MGICQALTVLLLLASSIGAHAEDAAVCAPQPGHAAQWLGACQKAAEAGDGHAALMVGVMYWNGDGVLRDYPTAARWFQMADKANEPRAAKLLGDWAMVRLAQASKPEDADRAVLEEAIGWYQKALQIEPVPAARTLAQQRLEMLSHLKQQLPSR
jgi:TPR repeat protein